MLIARSMLTRAIRPNRQSGFVLDVSFNRVAVNKLLRDNRLPLWGNNRPETIVWIASEESGGRQILGAGQFLRRCCCPCRVPLISGVYPCFIRCWMWRTTCPCPRQSFGDCFRRLWSRLPGVMEWSRFWPCGFTLLLLARSAAGSCLYFGARYSTPAFMR